MLAGENAAEVRAASDETRKNSCHAEAREHRAQPISQEKPDKCVARNRVVEGLNFFELQGGVRDGQGETIALEPDEEAALKEIIKHGSDCRERDRTETILLLAAGWSDDLTDGTAALGVRCGSVSATA